jgi:hypothetical protein
MYLTAFLHRDKLYEITNRWLSDKLAVEDPLIITKIITYDSFAAWEMLLAFADNLLPELNQTGIHRKRIMDKKELKDAICNAPFQHPERTRTLIENYRQMSEFYYIGSPVAGYVYFDGTPGFVGVCRFKRVKRIAEKASRYASLYLTKEVQTASMQVANRRAGLDETSDAIFMDRMLRAEEEVMQRIKAMGVVLPKQLMNIQDILGIKLVDTGFGESTLEATIDQFPRAEIIEKERHSGNYNAIHYIVELKADYEFIINRFDDNCNRVNYSSRGLPKEDIQRDFIDFIKTGKDTVQLDLILTTYEELVESEVGRSMHESRIFKQRQAQKYQGNIPINVEYIIEYLLAVGLSPEIQIDGIPVKTWGRYLPDTLSYIIRKLYGMPEYCLIQI